MSPTVRILGADERRLGLGATDIAAIVGVSPWKAPIDVYRDKVFGAADVPSWRMRMGQILEAAVADAYAEQTGVRLARIGVVYHKEYPFLYAHPDRRVMGQRGLVEVKTTSYRERFADGPPPDVRVQALWQLHLTFRDWCDVVVLFGNDITTHRVEYDGDLAMMLETEAVRFWREHVLPQVPPPIDGTRSYRAWLEELHPEETEDERVATPEEQLLLDELRLLREQVKEVDARKDLIENTLRAKMAEVGRLVAPTATVTYRLQPAQSYEVNRPASRVLRVNYKKGEEA